MQQLLVYKIFSWGIAFAWIWPLPTSFSVQYRFGHIVDFATCLQHLLAKSPHRVKTGKMIIIIEEGPDLFPRFPKAILISKEMISRKDHWWYQKLAWIISKVEFKSISFGNVDSAALCLILLEQNSNNGATNLSNGFLSAWSYYGFCLIKLIFNFV